MKGLILVGVVFLILVGSVFAVDLWLTSGDDIYNSNTGNVGIGTNTPQSKLDVAGTLELSSETEPEPEIKYTGGKAFKISNVGFGDLIFATNNKNRITIRNNGYVGIGVNYPNYVLDIFNTASKESTIHIISANTGWGSNDGVVFGLTSNNNSDFGIINKENSDVFVSTNNEERFRISNSGEVSINNLEGVGDAYACINNDGKLYRSSVPCV